MEQRQRNMAEDGLVEDGLVEEWLTVGRIVAAQGLNGELRVYPDSDFPERFLQPGDRWLRRPGQATVEQVQLLGGRYIPQKNLYILKLAGIDYRDQAEALRDAELVVAASDRPPLDEGEFHVMDLIGLQVYDQASGELVGTVLDVLNAGHDLLEIELAQPLALAEQSSEPPLPQTAPGAAPGTAPGAALADRQSEGAAAAAGAGPEAFTRRKGRRKAAKDRKKAAKPERSPRIWVPFVHDIVPVVDLEARRIELTPPPGLLELSQ